MDPRHSRITQLAAESDAGFDHGMFAEALGSLRQITDADVDLYGLSLGELSSMRERFEAWRNELRPGI